MSQFAWDEETEVETEAEEQEQQPRQPELVPQPPAEEKGSLALSVDDFAALEERILRAVNLVKRERLARAAAEERAAKAEAELAEQQAFGEQAQKELSALRTERDTVRQRVERLLSQLDALEL